jgi:outer membrane protein assembly factor BamA
MGYLTGFADVIGLLPALSMRPSACEADGPYVDSGARFTNSDSEEYCYLRLNLLRGNYGTGFRRNWRVQMNKVNAFLRGMTVFGGLVIAQAGWAQTGVPPPSPTSPTQPGPADPTQPDLGGARPTGTPPATAPAGTLPMGKIAKITVLGNKNISTETVLAAVTEKTGDNFDTAAAEQDRLAITALGYWAGQAQLADLTDTKGGVDLTFSVVENPVVQSIQFNANTLTGEPTIPAGTLLAQMATKTGQVLNTNTLQSDLDTLFNPNTGFARRQGYRFTVGSSINITHNKGVLTIPIVEDYVQAVLVTGNTKTSTADILNALPVKAGDLYQDKTVQRELTSGRSAGRVHITGPARLETLGPGRVVITVPVAEGR